ncbi:FUSC family protein [Paenibacillus eucommiae]|uniref:Aromatic acid exporter family protein n=1 Tax=Paenibacillus eucommiae TaxID=1355755 RepID=A0ABS4IVV1_9BACL|nr:aromatic acid exporter family protein [Paenibacillus eucommiae]MBP1991126.1 hypothetical protein [Paenibacillus eucommiae]
MIVGLRVIKTIISIAISISIARLLHLEPDHFAGIVSMLAIQPSVYRSLHHTLSHMASALLASVIGITAALVFGNGSFVIAVVALLVMTLHVKLRQTASLTLAVIVAINTMGTSDDLAGSAAAYNQFLLVLIGMTVGTVVNVVRKPRHHEREEVLLEKSESMLRVLLHFIRLDLEAKRMTPYKSEMRLQIEEVRGYIEKGKGISQLIREDRWLSRGKNTGAGEMFRTYETMVERIRDLVKALQKADVTHAESARLIRAIDMVIRGQERMKLDDKSFPLSMLLRAMAPSREANPDHQEMSRLLPYYQAYEALADYLRELEASASIVIVRPVKHRTLDASTFPPTQIRFS